MSAPEKKIESLEDTASVPFQKQELTVLPFKLMLIVALVVCALAVVNAFTAPRITAYKNERIATALSTVMPSATEFKEEAFEPVEGVKCITKAYKAFNGTNFCGYCFTVTVDGYSEIELVVGVNALGSVSGIKIVSNAETPGIGSKALSDDYLSLFVDTTLESDVDAVSGATLTSNAIKEASKAALLTADAIGKES